VLKTDISRSGELARDPPLRRVAEARGIIGIAGVDTRALTALIRDHGMPNAVIAHDPDGKFDVEALKREAAAIPSMIGLDLVPGVTTGQSFSWDQTTWQPGGGYGTQTDAPYHVVALDYGIKRNILRLLADEGCRVTVLPPRRVRRTCLPTIRTACSCRTARATRRPPAPMPCRPCRRSSRRACRHSASASGHQILGLALGGNTVKMHQGHHGANHPVKDFTTGKVEIVSMNHGFRPGSRKPALKCRRDACLAVRRLQLRHPGEGPAGVLRAVPPGSLARPAGQPLSVWALRGNDA
jgi:carbamoyl-phosphate synthase small subunit